MRLRSLRESASVVPVLFGVRVSSTNPSSFLARFSRCEEQVQPDEQEQ